MSCPGATTLQRRRWQSPHDWAFPVLQAYFGSLTLAPLQVPRERMQGAVVPAPLDFQEHD